MCNKCVDYFEEEEFTKVQVNPVHERLQKRAEAFYDYGDEL